VWEEKLDEDDHYREIQYNKVEQQLTKLEHFSGSNFRKYLFGKQFEKGIGLKMSFKDTYFIFERLG
jgi:hypothetical protein